MYTKTVWANGGTPAINDTNLALIEGGIERAHLGTHIYGLNATGNDTYVLTFSPVLGSYNTGLIINMALDVGNTGAATLNVNALGAKDIKKRVETGKVALVTGDMTAAGIYTLIYDGTDFVVVNPNLVLGVLSQGYVMGAAVPGWTNVMLGSKQVYTSNNTFTAPKTGVYRVTVTGGGGSASNTASGFGGGGGSGGTAIEFVTLTKDDDVTVTIGAGGAHPAGDGAGVAGGTSSFGAYCSGAGGLGGVTTGGAAGGAGTGGDINITGGYGSAGTDQGISGGGSYWGGQSAYGSGGHTSLAAGSASYNSGIAGVVLIEW